jgi:hypothetical protein
MMKIAGIIFLVLFGGCMRSQGNFIIAGQYMSGDYFFQSAPYDTVINIPGNSSGNYSLDINNDGKDDFILKMSSPHTGMGVQSYFTCFQALDSNQVAVQYIDTCLRWGLYPYLYSIAKGFQNGDTISSLIWDSIGYLNYTDYASQHNCGASFGGVTLYVGVRVRIGSDYQYGWIHLVDFFYNPWARSGVVMDNYACENDFQTVDEPGQNLSGVSVYPNPVGELLFIKTQEENIFGFEFLDISGKRLKHDEVNSNLFSMDISEFASGTYFLKLRTASGVSTKRVCVQH